MCASDATGLCRMHHDVSWHVPSHVQNGGHVAWLSPCSNFICRRGKHNIEQVTSKKGGVCFSASGRGERVPSGNCTELQREKAVLGRRAGVVALPTVVVTS